MSSSSPRFQRTKLTAVSDEELALLDVMFDMRVPRWALSSDRYGDAFNVPYTHAMSDQALDRRLVQLEREGLIFTEPGPRDHTYFGLTAEGGATWEKERVPDWGAYCYSSEMGPDEAPGWVVVEVVVYDRDVGVAFLRRAGECGLYPDVRLDLLQWVPSDDGPIYWRREPPPWSATFRVPRDDDKRVDGTSLWANRSWWSDINDLTDRLSRSG